jgi:hypothetical protein
MSNLDDYFKTTSYNEISAEIKEPFTDNNFTFVKGSDLYNDANNDKFDNTIYVKFYQIAIFSNNDMRHVRSYLLKGSNSEGSCFYNYEIKKIKNYKIKNDDVRLIIDSIEKNKKKAEKNIKYKYLQYPVYDFSNTPPPNGNDINECISELLHH